MAPALTEPISHRQSKISSPAQASSPRPIIGDLTEQTQQTTTTATIDSTIAQAHLVNQTNGNAAKDSTEEKLLITSTSSPLNQQQQQIHDIESSFIESNGPCLGPLFATHMDQSNNDQIDYQQQQNDQQQDQNTTDLFDAIADSTETLTNSQHNNQMDCGNLNAIQTTVEELLAQTQTQEFQQQFQQEFLQQQNQGQNQNFDLTQFNPQNVQTMDLLMADDQSHHHHHQASGANTIHSTINSSPMSSQMPSNFLKDNAEMEQILGDFSTTDIDLMQVLKCFESTPAGENLGDLAGGLSLFNDVDVMNIGLEDVVGTR